MEEAAIINIHNNKIQARSKNIWEIKKQNIFWFLIIPSHKPIDHFFSRKKYVNQQ